jgi:hypothetical protein
MASICRSCDGLVFWRKEKEKWQCYNQDGTTHWDKCSERKTQKFLTEGKRVESNNGQDFGYKLKTKKINKTQMFQITGAKQKAGIHYKKDNCNCGLPPWGLCKENCEHRITHRNQQEVKDWLADYAVKHDCISSKVDPAPAELLTEQASHLREIMGA